MKGITESFREKPRGFDSLQVLWVETEGGKRGKQDSSDEGAAAFRGLRVQTSSVLRSCVTSGKSLPL